MKVISKRDLDEAYLKFITEKEREYELHDYEEEFDFIEYMRSDKGRIWDEAGEIIRAIYCPGDNENEWEEWQLGSEEEINIGELFQKVGIEQLVAYESIDDFCADLFLTIGNHNKTEDFFFIPTDEVIERKDYVLQEMTDRINKVNISSDGEISNDDYVNYKETCERCSKADSRWILVEPIIKLFDCLNFRDVYDFNTREINEIFDEIIKIKEKVMAFREQLVNNTYYEISEFDLDCLGLDDFKVKDGELEIMWNKSVYDAILNMDLEKELEEDLGR